ncbi:MAG: CPBP family intramembrane metalloprotease [Candidatus Omnitrophica bacterium]|nr:CPBP family intramembrane metalloprotease [Candidatus Omnitrophota bacterium]
MSGSWLTTRRLYLWLVAAILVLQGVPFLLVHTHRSLLQTSLPTSSSPSAIERLVDARLQPESLRETLTRYPQVALLFNFLSLLGAALFAIGCILDLRWLRRRRQALPPPLRALGRYWSLGDVGRLLILSLFIASLTPWLAGILLFLRHHRPDPVVELLLVTAAAEFLILWMVAVYARGKGQRLLPATGLAGVPLREALGLGVRSYLSLLPPLIGMLILGGWIAKLVGYTPPPHPLSTLFLEEERAGVLLFGAVFACVAGPFLEEIFFRGIFFQALRSRLTARSAMMVSAVLFASLHHNWVAFAPITLLGCLLAYLYEETGSLWASVIVHILHNSSMIFMVWLMRLLVRLPLG